MSGWRRFFTSGENLSGVSKTRASAAKPWFLGRSERACGATRWLACGGDSGHLLGSLAAGRMGAMDAVRGVSVFFPGDDRLPDHRFAAA